MNRKPCRCSTCREQSVVPAILETYETDLPHDGRNYRVTVRDVSVLRCESCGELVLPTETHEILDDALRVAAGLMLPAEIRESRERLGLSQQELADLMGSAAVSISRWETGFQIQSRSSNQFLKVIFGVPATKASSNNGRPTDA